MTSAVDALFDARAAAVDLRVPEELKARLLSYYGLLARWNRTINLTSLLDPERALDRLLMEPLLAARYLPSHPYLIDLGSGGGSPAIPLALALSSSFLVMVESRSRKAAFLREAARELSLSATVEATRFETLIGDSRYARKADLVTIRAVRPEARTLDVAASLAKDKGLIAVFASSPVMSTGTGLTLSSSHSLAQSSELSLLERST